MSSDKPTRWVYATVLILLAALGYVMVVAYAHGVSEAEDVARSDDGAAPGGPPGAPTRAQVKHLQDALTRRLGVNGRGLPRVAHMDYDGWPDRMLVVFALDDDSATMTPARPRELRPMYDVLRGIHGGGLRWRWVMLSGTAPVEAAGGAAIEGTAFRAVFSREKLDKADWSILTPADLRGLAEQWWVDPKLTPATRPASREVQSP